MARILRNWSRLNRQARVNAANLVKTKLTGNADVATPNPTLAVLGAAATAAQQAIDDVATMEADLAALRSTRDTKIDALMALLGQEASTVEGATAGVEAKLLAAGFQIVAQAATPVGELPPPQDLRATAGDNDGELDGQCDAVAGAGSYEWQTTATPNEAASWVARQTTTRSSVTITGLPSGQRCWLRVRAIGAAGPGAWSDAAGKMVP